MSAPSLDPNNSQRAAADPASDVWVTANAGSGKTKVLTDRVARLLLAGSKPERILCLTYTRAAAAEMNDRLARLLGDWTMKPDKALTDDLVTLTGEPRARFDAERLRRARILFAEALETPGGLKIGTIHGFCDAALRRFPVEAGVAPGFAVLEEDDAQALQRAALDAMAEAAARGDDDAFDLIAATETEFGLDKLVEEILRRRALLRDPLSRAALAAHFGVDPDADPSAPIAALGRALDRDRLRGAAAVLERVGGKWNTGLAGRLRPAIEAQDAPTLRAALAHALFTKGVPRKLGSMMTNAAREADPTLDGFIADLLERFTEAEAQAVAVEGFLASWRLTRFGAAFIAAYDAAKGARGALDFNDLIDRARALLAESPAAQWALYKLDGGIDHILLDEAQDTAPEQWAMLEALDAEITAGAGARDAARSLFVVGDEKQSIYSFQGAAPKLFGAMRERLNARRADASKLNEAPMVTSFRSAEAILRAVDQTFAGAAGEGLRGGVDPIHHRAFQGFAGRVDLWPDLLPEGKPPEQEWWRPLDAERPAAPRIRLARAIAAEIAGWLDRGETLPGEDRPITPGDILVLTRNRDVFAAELLRELKRADAPVAGADRMKLSQEIVVRDLCALARFALTPEDDLTLAALLRSPLCGLSEEALFALAHPRGDKSLWEALRGSDHAAIRAELGDALDGADFRRPYEFFARALGQRGGRRRLMARLGQEAEEAIDEFLARALAHERDAPPTLEHFLARLETQEINVKREQDKTAGALRVMTVHGAKGLEAPVVFLADLVTRAPNPPMCLPAAGARALLRRGAKTPALEAAEAARKQAEAEENRRLLYVAMTRAERWLIVARAGKAQSSVESWSGLVRDGLGRIGAPIAELPAPQDLPGAMLRMENAPRPDYAPKPAADQADAAPPAEAPEWLRRPVPPPLKQRALAASALGGAAEGGGVGLGGALARARGRIVHDLLEHWPDDAPEARDARAQALLAALPEALRAGALAEARAGFALAEREGYFGADTLAEAELSLALPGLAVTGRVDRLDLAGEALRLLDFKTDPRPPEDAGTVPEPYLRQMAAYREALRRLHPGRAVECRLLYTAAPRLIRLPDALLDAALARIGRD